MTSKGSEIGRGEEEMSAHKTNTARELWILRGNKRDLEGMIDGQEKPNPKDLEIYDELNQKIKKLEERLEFETGKKGES